MKLNTALEGGLAGAFALSLLHELLKWKNPDAPHMDELGVEALSKTLHFAKMPINDDTRLFLTALAGDLLANATFYSAAGIGKADNVWLRGVLLGLSAGIGGVLLPKPMGLRTAPTNRSMTTKLFTLALYVTGGLVASAVMHHLESKEQ